ncbi:MAG: ArnT family glycosyltransferase [Anaerolineales bacterium]
MFRFSMDEGIALMVGRLIERGYPLYSQIWNDQPPLFFYMLAELFPVLGFDVGMYRLVVLLISGLLLWAVFQFLSIVWDRLYAVIGVVLILLLPKYLVLSVSVMAGLPAITFAMLSLLSLALWHLQRRRLWLVLSALLLAVSVQIKLFTGFLAPIFLIGILAAELTRVNRKLFRIKVINPVVLWGTVFAGVSMIIVLFLVGPEHVSQLLQDHLAAREVETFNNFAYTIHWHLRQAWLPILLGLIGAINVVRQQRWLALYLVAWTGIAYGLLAGHTPVWDHQQILVTIPAAMLASSTVCEGYIVLKGVIRTRLTGIEQDSRPSDRVAGMAAAGIILLILAALVPGTLRLLSPLPSVDHSGLNLQADQRRVLNIMQKYASQTEWVVTDQLMFAFRTRLPVPPNLAVFTSKRLETGELTEGEIIETIVEWRPEQVLLTRSPYPSVSSFLERDYDLVYGSEDMRLYVREDLLG